MLHPTDLGSGWHEGFTPAISVLASGLPAGASDAASTFLVASHLNRQNWVIDENVVEGTYAFPNRAAALRYVRSWESSQSPKPKSHYAAFVVASRAFTLQLVPNKYGLARSFSRAAIVEAAKRRAISGR
jgi:hypothetical protein